MRSIGLSIGFLVLSIVVYSAPALSQAAKSGANEYPTKPIRMVAGFAAGGGSDNICRPLAIQMSQGLGHQVIVDNRVGAGNSIASDFVAKASPDGYTLQCVNANHTLNAFVYGNLPYDTERDFAGVSQISTSALILVGTPALQANTVKELIALAKAKPNTLNAGTSGTSGSGAVTTAILKQVTGMPFVIIPYKAATEAMLGLIRGDLQFAVASQSSAMALVRSGKLKVIAVHSKKRLPHMPDVPTLEESGLRGLDLGPWEGVIAPAKTPVAIIDKLNREIVRSLKQRELVSVYEALGVEPVGSTPAEFNEHIRGQMALFRQTFKDGKIGGG